MVQPDAESISERGNRVLPFKPAAVPSLVRWGLIEQHLTGLRPEAILPLEVIRSKKARVTGVLLNQANKPLQISSVRLVVWDRSFLGISLLQRRGGSTGISSRARWRIRRVR
jgi:hypothetical protein